MTQIVSCLIALLINVQLSMSQVLPPIFANNMVLLRSNPVVYGFDAPPNSLVTVTLNDSVEFSSLSSDVGFWNVSLGPQAASSANTLTVKTTDDQQTIQKVAFGEVILCSGQANMEYTVSASFNFDIYGKDDIPDLRFYTVKTVASTTPVYKTTNRESSVCNNAWCSAKPETLDDAGEPFNYPSGVCYFTTRQLYYSLGGLVPVGSITSSESGTPIEAWSSVESWQECPQSDVQLPTPENGFSGDFSKDGYYWTSCMWNSMMLPLVNMKFSAVVWYQGEGNSDSVSHATTYGCQIVSLIKSWRSYLDSPSLPFIVVMLTPWPEGPANTFNIGRQSQLMALQLPNTAVTCTIDLGDNPDLDPEDHGEHPESKDIVGYRVFLQLLDLAYQGQVVSNGPQHTRVDWPTSSVRKIVLHYPTVFETSSSSSSSFRGTLPYYNVGLVFNSTFKCSSCCSTSPYVLVLSDGSSSRLPFQVANIAGEELVVLTVAEDVDINAIAELQFDHEGYPECALFNEKGLPAYPAVIQRQPSQR